MKQDGDVTGRDAEHPRHVLAGSLLEHAEGDDGALHVAQLLNAGPETNVLFGVREELVGLW